LAVVKFIQVWQEETVSAARDKESLIADILSLADRLFRELLPTVPRDILSLDITMPQMKILLILYVGGSMRMSAIASRLDVTLPTASSLVDRLVEKQYVLREDDPDDRRVVLCHLSAKGTAALASIWHSSTIRCRELLQAMEGSKLAMFAEALRAMYDAARAEEPTTAS
jgi:DNA-binding MarR family transcriptional regulator